MKKSIYLVLAALSLALFACNSKPASDQPAEEPEAVEVVNEEPTEAPEEAEEPADSLALVEEPADSLTVAEEQPAEEPVEEPAPLAEQAPATPSDKFEIRNSDGNYIAFVNEVVTADADRCFEISMVMDKEEETKVKLVIQISKIDGSKIGLYPVAIDKGGTKASFRFCPPGGIFDAIKAGEQYKLSFVRAQL